uniref:Fibropellin-3-like n=1 Tax=Petromyzon marinus TaxID=7757 RepID=A0AAJ7WXZ7_PETMA|nr:fibropellin-3-like [Petromyzon marinus]
MPLAAAGCQSNPCLNGGTCDDELYYPNYWCACIPPWSGSNCDYYVPTPSPAGCQSNPCLNGGTCDDELYYPNYWCACIPPWSGSNCDYYVPTPPPEPITTASEYPVSHAYITVVEVSLHLYNTMGRRGSCLVTV